MLQPEMHPSDNCLNHKTSDRYAEQAIDQFYEHFSGWRTDIHAEEFFRILALIKRIVIFSLAGVGFLTQDKQEKLIERLSELREGLFYGRVKRKQSIEALNGILHKLLEDSPLAMIAAQAARIEMMLGHSQELSQKMQQIFDQALSKLSHDISALHAQGLLKELGQWHRTLSSSPSMEIVYKIEAGLKHWINF